MDSIILKRVALQDKRDIEIQQINQKYVKEVKIIQSQCPHTYEDGSDATHEYRVGYNQYYKMCDVCEKEWDSEEAEGVS